MKKYFYILVSLSAVVLTSVGSFSILGKHSQATERKARLDRYYFKELSVIYFSILDPNTNNQRINRAYDWKERTEDHMSKDGYDWQQINELERLAESEKSKQISSTNLGYEDASGGKDPDKNYLEDPFYIYGFEEGKKIKIDKEGSN